MTQAIRIRELDTRPELGVLIARPAHQALRLLQIGYAGLFLFSGTDKFIQRMVDWPSYFAPAVSRPIPTHLSTVTTMAGIVELVCALLIVVKPSIGAYAAALWIAALSVNLALGGHYFMVACGVMLLLGSLALGRLAQGYQREPAGMD